MSNKAELSVEHVVKLAFCLEGRDKITKVLQYGSRMMAYYYLSVDPKSDIGLRMQKLYTAAQQSRKAFRLGKSLSEYENGVKTYNDKTLIPWQQSLKLIKHSGMGGYLLYDNMVFFSRAKVLDFDANECSKRGGILWFIASLAALILAIAALQKDIARESYYRSVLSSSQVSSVVRSFVHSSVPSVQILSKLTVVNRKTIKFHSTRPRWRKSDDPVRKRSWQCSNPPATLSYHPIRLAFASPSASWVKSCTTELSEDSDVCLPVSFCTILGRTLSNHDTRIDNNLL